jgi:hypothetical protein
MKAETTLLDLGLLVSTFDFTDLLLVGVEAFLLTRDFFSIAIVVSPVLFILFNCFTQYPSASRWPNSVPSSGNTKLLKTMEGKGYLLPALLHPSPAGVKF